MKAFSVFFRSYDKQPSGGIAVPVVKSSTSSASWLHHPLSAAPSYDWHGVTSAAAAADSYAAYGKTGTGLATSGARSDMYGTDLSHIQYGRGVIETPKVGKGSFCHSRKHCCW